MDSYRIKVGSLYLGGGSPVAIQSMCNTLTSDTQKTIQQINALEKAGCDLVRVSVPDKASATALKEIKETIRIPLIADIHFDWQLALAAIENGADKIRINPGNIQKENLKKIVAAAKKHKIPMRIGINAGSLEKDLLKKHGKPNAKALVESALRNVQFIEELGFKNLVISLKHSDVKETIQAYRLIAPKIPYPLHLGVTEAGTFLTGTVKSSIALGSLLNEGIGDTLRVSLSAEPVKEVEVAYKILEALNLRNDRPRIISCPTCARTTFDVQALAEKLEKETRNLSVNATVAVMGCLVNGPGEAREADLGICAQGKNAQELMFFKKGRLIGKIPLKQVVQQIKKELQALDKGQQQ